MKIGVLAVSLVLEMMLLSEAGAAENAAKAAWRDKRDAFELCQAQNRVAAEYFADAQARDRQVRPPVPTPPCVDPGAFNQEGAPNPLEGGGAHSPPETADTPPNNASPQAEPQREQQPEAKS